MALRNGEGPQTGPPETLETQVANISAQLAQAIAHAERPVRYDVDEDGDEEVDELADDEDGFDMTRPNSYPFPMPVLPTSRPPLLTAPQLPPLSAPPLPCVQGSEQLQPSFLPTTHPTPPRPPQMKPRISQEHVADFQGQPGMATPNWGAPSRGEGATVLPEGLGIWDDEDDSDAFPIPLRVRKAKEAVPVVRGRPGTTIFIGR
ncbi:hypothetical protein OF83DRAFT_663359 [Amylostereum chailletii]|nr:hypothetical protein OF83DRAFT_663359 [Amylostereum chailletii]